MIDKELLFNQIKRNKSKVSGKHSSKMMNNKTRNSNLNKNKF